MKEWIPVPGTVKARLVEVALVRFGLQGFQGTPVGDLAAEAGVTTGALYHHFGSKAGLYDTVRTEVERRVLDRMEGARAVPGADLATVLAVGYDAVERQRAWRLLSEDAPTDRTDLLAQAVSQWGEEILFGLGPLLVGAWRAALREAAAGAPVDIPRRALIRLVRGVGTPGASR